MTFLFLKELKCAAERVWSVFGINKSDQETFTVSSTYSVHVIYIYLYKLTGHSLNDILLKGQLKENTSNGNSQRITNRSFVKIHIQLWYATTFFILNCHMYKHYQIMTKNVHVLMLVTIRNRAKEKSSRVTTPPYS